MRHKSITLLSIILLGSTLSLLDPAGYDIAGLGFSKILKVDLNQNGEMDNVSENSRLDYIRGIYNLNNPGLMKLYERSSSSTFDAVNEKTGLFDVSLEPNIFLAKKRADIVYRLEPKQSFEYIDGIVVMDGVTYDEMESGTIKSVTIESIKNDNDNEILIPAFWKTKKNWQGFSEWVFGFIKIIFNVVMVAMTVGRPFMPDWMKLRAAWVAQTVIFYQLTMYVGLTPGRFGGMIDQIFSGMLWNTRRYAFIGPWPQFKEETGFIFYKYYQHGFRNHFFEECFIEVCLVVFFSILSFMVSLASQDENGQSPIVKTVKEMTSMIYLFTFIPIMVHLPVTLFAWAILDDQQFYTIFNVLLGIAVLLFYSIQIGNMIKGMDMIKYLHDNSRYDQGRTINEQGLDWAFDSFLSKNSHFALRLAEYFFYIFIAMIWTSGYLWNGFAIFAILIAYIGLLVITGIRRANMEDLNSNERRQQRTIVEFTCIHLLLKVIEFLLLQTFTLFKKMKLKNVKLITWFYMIIFTINIFVILGQLILRLLNLGLKPEYNDERENLWKKGAQNNAKYNSNYDQNTASKYNPNSSKMPFAQPESRNPMSGRSGLNNGAHNGFKPGPVSQFNNSSNIGGTQNGTQGGGTELGTLNQNNGNNWIQRDKRL